MQLASPAGRWAGIQAHKMVSKEREAFAEFKREALPYLRCICLPPSSPQWALSSSHEAVLALRRIVDKAESELISRC